jgi:hypothetical protein
MSETQLNIEWGKARKEAGMKRAVDHANAVHDEWEEMAFSFFLNVFLKHHKGVFMCEQVRLTSEGVVPDPPSLRAWGGIITRAKFKGFIVKAGPPRPVKNPKAQMAFAQPWKRAANYESLIYQYQKKAV